MFERFRERSHELERIDTGDYSPAEYALWEREMGWIHGVLGEKRALDKTLLAEANALAHPISVLDVGCGTGGVLAHIRKKLCDRAGLAAGVEMDVNGAIAMIRSGLPAVLGDGLQLPFADQSFDYVYCTLVLHHLEDVAAVRLLREMNRVARFSIFAVDLNRDPLAYYTYRLLGKLLLQPLTLHDGSLSILKSRTRDELKELAAAAGLSNVKVVASRVNRLVLSAGG